MNDIAKHRALSDAFIVRLDAARRALSQAETIQKKKQVADVALAAKIYAKRQGLSKELVSQAHAIHIEALSQVGGMLKATSEQREHGSRGIGKSGVPKGNPTLAALGLDKKTSAVAQALAKIAAEEPQQFERVKSGEKSVTQVKRERTERTRNERRTRNAVLVQTAQSQKDAMTVAKFATIVIDPPWDWGDEGDVDQMGRARPIYQTMTFEELLAEPIGDHADIDAHIYLWITNRSLPKGFALLDAWGFRYITCLTWCKPSFGMGNYFRGQTEHVLFGVKGSLPLKRKDAGTFFHAPRGQLGHSSKPVQFYDLVESCSPGPYLEKFGRGTPRHGWVVDGAEVDRAA